MYYMLHRYCVFRASGRQYRFRVGRFARDRTTVPTCHWDRSRMRRSLLSFHLLEEVHEMDRSVAIDDNTFYHCMFYNNTLGSLDTLRSSILTYLRLSAHLAAHVAKEKKRGRTVRPERLLL